MHKKKNASPVWESKPLGDQTPVCGSTLFEDPKLPLNFGVILGVIFGVFFRKRVASLRSDQGHIDFIKRNTIFLIPESNS